MNGMKDSENTVNRINPGKIPSLFITSETPKRIQGGLRGFEDAIQSIHHITNVGAEPAEFTAELIVNTRIINYQPVKYVIRPGERTSIHLILASRPIIDILIHLRSTDGSAIQSITATIDSLKVEKTAYFDPLDILDPELSQYLSMRFNDAFLLGKSVVLMQDYLDIGWDRAHKDEVLTKLYEMQAILSSMGVFTPPVSIEGVEDFLALVQKFMEHNVPKVILRKHEPIGSCRIVDLAEEKSTAKREVNKESELKCANNIKYFDASDGAMH